MKTVKTRRIDTTESVATGRNGRTETVEIEALEPKKTISSRSTDLTNRRFNHLTAISPTPEKRNGYTVWHCICDCGLEAYYPSRLLKRGTAKDCGDDACEYHIQAVLSRREKHGYVDLTGQRFGKLVVVDPVDPISSATVAGDSAMPSRATNDMSIAAVDNKPVSNTRVDNDTVVERAAAGATAGENAEPTRVDTVNAVISGADTAERDISLLSTRSASPASPILSASPLLSSSGDAGASGGAGSSGAAATVGKPIDPATVARMRSGVDGTGRAGVDGTGRSRAGKAGEAGSKDSRGQLQWLCLCDCGNTVITTTGQLRSGNKKSCGCLSNPPLKDWVGKRFGHLVVTAHDGWREGVHYWRCICDCGVETVVRQSSLMSGHTTSCGCQKEPTRTLVDGTCVEIVRAAVEKKTVPKNNTSGVRGVYWSRTRGLWIAQITFKGKTRYLGGYRTIGEAKRARREAEERLFVEFLEEYDSGMPSMAAPSTVQSYIGESDQGIQFSTGEGWKDDTGGADADDTGGADAGGGDGTARVDNS